MAVAVTAVPRPLIFQQWNKRLLIPSKQTEHYPDIIKVLLAEDY